MNFIHGVGLTSATMMLLGVVVLYVAPPLVFTIVALIGWVFGL